MPTNTIDQLGDSVAAAQLIDRSIDSFTDDTVTSIGTYAFYGCAELTSASFPAATFIGASAFFSCSKLTTLRLENTEQVCTLFNVNAFYNTSRDLIVYVPDALVDSYKAATNWSTYASRINGISELPAT